MHIYQHYKLNYSAISFWRSHAGYLVSRHFSPNILLAKLTTFAKHCMHMHKYRKPIGRWSRSDDIILAMRSESEQSILWFMGQSGIFRDTWRIDGEKWLVRWESSLTECKCMLSALDNVSRRNAYSSEADKKKTAIHVVNRRQAICLFFSEYFGVCRTLKYSLHVALRAT